MPPVVEKQTKEKVLEPKGNVSKKVAGKTDKIVVGKGDGSSSSSKPSQKEKAKKSSVSLKPIDENQAAPDDI